MMVKNVRLKTFFFSGVTLSFILLLFAFFIFYTLYTAEVTSATMQMDNSRIYFLLKFTFYQATLSTVLSLLVGILLSWALAHKAQFRGRELLVALFSSSLVLPTLVVVFGLIGIFGRNGWINQLSMFLFDTSLGSYIYGLGGILLAHVYLNASFASRALLHSFESIPKEKYKLAKSLDFSLFRRFIYVEYPALKSTLLSIGSTIFLLCFTSFAVVLLLGGSPSYNTLEVAIYEAVKLDFDISMALKLALIQLSISAVFIVLSSSFRVGLLNLKTSSTNIIWRDSKHVQVFQSFIIIFFTLFFLSPLLVVIIDGIDANYGHILSDVLFIKSFFTSVILAIISSIFTIIIALVLSDTIRNFTLDTRYKANTFSKIFNAMVTFSGNIYLAIPSLVLGLGFFLMSQKYGGSQFIWSLVALLIANVLMSLPFALGILGPVMQKTAQRYDKLVFSLGLTKIQRWVYVEYPYMKSALAYVFALAFCFSLGDLGIIAHFGSDEFTTLPWYLYQLMGSYRNADAAGVALVMLVMVLGVFILVPKLFRGKS